MLGRGLDENEKVWKGTMGNSLQCFRYLDLTICIPQTQGQLCQNGVISVSNKIEAYNDVVTPKLLFKDWRVNGKKNRNENFKGWIQVIWVWQVLVSRKSIECIKVWLVLCVKPLLCEIRFCRGEITEIRGWECTQRAKLLSMSKKFDDLVSYLTCLGPFKYYVAP